MTFRGKVKNGRVLLDNPKALPEGTEVEVRPIKVRGKPGKGKKRPRSLAEQMAPFIGKAKHLPSDLSVNLDHYLYGHPKRK